MSQNHKIYVESMEGEAANMTAHKPNKKAKVVPLWQCGVTVVAVVALLAALVVFVVLYVVAKTSPDDAYPPRTMPQWPPPSLSPMGKYTRVAVAADNQLCSEIGRDVMIKGGNAADAAISTLLCTGVMDAHSSGIGGGHFLTFYHKLGKKCYVIDAREKAPLRATKDMYRGDPEGSKTGWRAIAVPGEIHGLYTLYKNFGSKNVSWSELLQPIIDLLEAGFPVSDALHIAMLAKKSDIMKEPTLNIFINNNTGTVYNTGEIMRRPVLAATLRRIANTADPIGLFYRGSVARDIVDDISENGGLVNMTDMERYSSIVRKDDEVMYSDLGEASGLTSCGPPPPSSSAIVHAILNVISKFDRNASLFERTFENEATTFHRFVEVMKFAYANRGNMGDMDFVPEAFKLAKIMTTNEYAETIMKKITDRSQPMWYYETDDTKAVQEDHGTSHMSIIDELGNAVSVTSTINLYFGSKRRSRRTGIILNDEMDDFSTPGQNNAFGYPPSPENFIYPEKRPMSSMSPSVIFNRNTGQVELVLGAAGGSKIISGTAYIALRMILFRETVKEALDAPRLHNQFIPNATQYERGFPKEYVTSLLDRGQIAEQVGNLSVATAIQRGTDGFWYANSDRRKGTASSTAGY